MSSTWLIIAGYALLGWFVVCLNRASKQITATWDMIGLINRNKIVNGDFELLKRKNTTLPSLLKVTLRLMFFR
jgi:hypothetical protein